MKYSKHILIILAIAFLISPVIGFGATDPNRYPNGITNVESTDPMGMLPIQDPTQIYTFFDDFNEYCSPVVLSPTITYGNFPSPRVIASRWVVSSTDAGSANTTMYVTQSIRSASYGILRAIMGAADNDGRCFQVGNNATPTAYFGFQPTKSVWFKARIASPSATQCDWRVGLFGTDQVGIDNATGVQDGVFFNKEDGITNIEFRVSKSGTQTKVLTAGTAAANTFSELSFYYDGADEIKYFVDGTHVGTSVTTNIPDDTAMVPAFMFVNGTEGPGVFDVDYIFVVQER